MDLLLLSALATATLSLQVNLFLWLKLKKALKSPPPVPTKEAQEVLAEIASGQAILKITVINAADIYLRSPRG